MSTVPARLPGADGGAHPLVFSRRMRELRLLALGGLLPLLIALAIALQVSHPSFALLFALAVGLVALVALIVSPRLEISVTILALYLGMLDGPVKLLSANKAASSVRDLLIGAVTLGVVLRMLASREKAKLPPLFGWVLAFVVLVLAEALNPKTGGTLKIIGGFRQQLEWVPFFFFGYMLMRSKERFRKMFIILGVIALANGIVSTYQTRLTPGQLASWGPGYSERVNGNEVLTARKYKTASGEALNRPPGLGSDSGFGGGTGVIALAGTLALFATSRRRRWVPALLALGAMVAVATGLGRLAVVGSVISIFAFAMLSLSAGRRVTRPLGAVFAILALAIPFGILFVSAEGSEVFSRYTSIAPENVASTSTSYKEKSLGYIPHYISAAPFGFGLATAGPASTFGGKVVGELEGHGVTAETQYNYVVDELGAPGLLLFVGLLVQLAVLVLRRLSKVRDMEVRIDLAAVFAVLFAYSVMGLRGAFMDTSAAGPFFWFAVGIAAYWLGGNNPVGLRPAEEARA